MTSARRKELEKYVSNPAEFGEDIPSRDELLEYIVHLLNKIENLEADLEEADTSRTERDL